MFSESSADWTAPTLSSYAEALTPDVAVFGEGDPEEVKVK